MKTAMIGAASVCASDLWAAVKPPRRGSLDEDAIKDYLYRIRHPDEHHDGDIVADAQIRKLIRRVDRRLLNVRKVVGFGNFNVLSFDDMLKYARRYSKIGRFGADELEFLEALFYEDAAKYGFFGEKPLGKITERVSRRAVVKIPRTGHFVFAGEPLKLYKKIHKEVGGKIALTSGVRSVVKQMQLFINKAQRSDGNLSMASRSLAPPGYSFHGVGDFDVGIRGWGGRNFTEDFAFTDEFKRLLDLGYVDIRYPEDNRLGVRFEPWHIKVG